MVIFRTIGAYFFHALNRRFRDFKKISEEIFMLCKYLQRSKQKKLGCQGNTAEYFENKIEENLKHCFSKYWTKKIVKQKKKQRFGRQVPAQDPSKIRIKAKIYKIQKTFHSICIQDLRSFGMRSASGS
jgi:hypothetical protein